MTGDTRTCAWCGLEFVSIQYAQKCCTYRCGFQYQNAKKPLKPKVASHCHRCGASLEGKRANAIYCSMSCKSMDHTFRHRGKTRIGGPARRRQIIERDSATCYLCDTVLDPQAVELDHLIPVAMGGDSSPANVAVACLRCNRSRGAKLTINQILKRNQIRSMAWQ